MFPRINGFNSSYFLVQACKERKKERKKGGEFCISVKVVIVCVN